MSDVFISYAREDRDQAEQLARVFDRQGWSVWWDKVIPPGRKYADVIGEELASAKALIVLWSRNSIASDWVKDEAQEGANRRVLVPALIEAVSPPVGFRQVQTADLSAWDGSSATAELESLVRSVGALISKPVSAGAFTAPAIPSNRRRLALYVSLAVLLVLAGGYFAFRSYRPGQNRIEKNSLTPTPAASASTNCDPGSRQKAAELTGKGMLMIDPGGNQAAAVLQFNEAILECPRYADAYFLRGQSFVALRQNERAIADFRKFLELSSDAEEEKKASEFIASLSAPAATPSATRGPSNVNTVATNSNTQGPISITGNRAPVQEMFGGDKSARITATTRMILERKQDSSAVQESVKSALSNIDNKSGVINTLVYLENVDPKILRSNQAEIQKLLQAARGNGPQTIDHINKVQKLLNSPS